MADRTNKGQNSYREIRKKRKRTTIWIVVASLTVLLLAFGMLACNEAFAWFKSDGEAVEVVMPDGGSVSEISGVLEGDGIINQSWLFQTYVKVTGQSDGFLMGTYELHEGQSYQEIIDIVKDSSKNVGIIKFVVPEGYTLDDIAAKLEKYDVCSGQEFLNAINDPDVYGNYHFADYITNKQLENKYYPMEGYAFPATYKFEKHTSAQDVAEEMLLATERNLSSYYDVIQNEGLSLDEVMTMAAIIQEEAGTLDDMPKISSVLHNRLNDTTYPYLQCTPTQKYASQIAQDMSEKGEDNNGISDGYDTFKSKGLPSGPICNPGHDAIEAALYPDQTDYYFFCSDLDTKETFYANTYEEHQQNLEKAGLA